MQATTPAHSDALVIFGITGDLAFKKIFPALENLERRGRLPGIVVGVARGGTTREALLERMRASLAQHGDGTDDAAVAPPGGQAAHGRRRLPRRRDVRGTARALDGAARPCHYLAIPPSLFAEVATRLGSSGCAAGARRRGREAARPRPLERADHQPRAAPGVRRGLDLPHRPFPRQGAGAEPALLPLRQLDHRAGLEPRPRRERADHHGGEVRRRGPRPAVRGTRRGARRGAEPPARGAGHPRHGAAGRHGRRGAARREDEGAARRPAPGAPRHRARPVRGLPRRGRRGGRTPTSRPTPRCASTSTPGAGPACRSSCAPASACR